jgi:hypothetical protein
MTDSSALILLVAALLATGAFSGFLAGLLGVGGGIVIVPVLFHVFDLFGVDPSIRMQVAVATSLSTIIPTAIVSARSHWRKGAVDRNLLRLLAPTVFVGVIIGTALAGIVSSHVLTAVFATVALVVSINMAMGPGTIVLGKQLPGPAGVGAIGTGIGMLSAMMGIGGGTLTVQLSDSHCRRHCLGARPRYRDSGSDRLRPARPRPSGAAAVLDRLCELGGLPRHRPDFDPYGAVGRESRPRPQSHLAIARLRPLPRPDGNQAVLQSGALIGRAEG